MRMWARQVARRDAASEGIFIAASFYLGRGAVAKVRRSFLPVAFWPQRGLSAAGKKKRSFFGTSSRRL
jgi:hypothetical protein